jgi:hypothetical protein
LVARRVEIGEAMDAESSQTVWVAWVQGFAVEERGEQHKINKKKSKTK